MMESTTVAGPTNGAKIGSTSGAFCGFTAMTIAAARDRSVCQRVEA